MAGLIGIAVATPAAGGPGLSLLVVGDWGRNGEFRQRDVAREMGRVGAESQAAFVISTGDNFYDKGVGGVGAPQWRTSFEEVYTAPSLQIPWYAVLGNHDYLTNPSAEVAYSQISARWKMPARYYTQTWELPGGGSVAAFFLDTQPFVEAYRKNSRYSDVARQSKADQLRWLEAGLAGSTADWKIVVGHHPVFSHGSAHGNTPELIRDVKPLLERYGVQVYLNGHDHDMERIVENGVEYLTSGAGSQTRPAGAGPNTRFSLGMDSGFLAIELTRNLLTGRFIDATGREVYAFTRPRGAPEGARP